MTELDTTSPTNPMYSIVTPETENPLDVGVPVRGWLLYYCISRTILGPLVFLYALHGLHLFRLIAIDVIEAIVGFNAGVLVWRRSRRWIHAVWSDLTARFVQVLIVAISWQSTSAVRPVRPGVHLIVGFIVAGWGLGLILAWFLYFRTSKRVRLTLGRNL